MTYRRQGREGSGATVDMFAEGARGERRGAAAEEARPESARTKDKGRALASMEGSLARTASAARWGFRDAREDLLYDISAGINVTWSKWTITWQMSSMQTKYEGNFNNAMMLRCLSWCCVRWRRWATLA